MGPSGLAVTPVSKSSLSPIVTTAIDVTDSIKAKFGKGYHKAVSVLGSLTKQDILKKTVLTGPGLLDLLLKDGFVPSKNPAFTALVKGGHESETLNRVLKSNKFGSGDFSLSIQFGRNVSAQLLAEEHNLTMNRKGRIFASAEVAAQNGWTASKP